MAVATVAQPRAPVASSPSKPEVVRRLISAAAEEDNQKDSLVEARTTNHMADIAHPSAVSPTSNSEKTSSELSPEPQAATHATEATIPPSSPSLAALASAALQLEPTKPAEQVEPAPTTPTTPTTLKASNTALTFLTLPADIHHLIATEFLPYHSVVALRSTSAYFHSLIPPPTLKRLRKRTVKQLLSEERVILDKWVAYGGGNNARSTQTLNCYACLKSQPITEFLATQVQGGRGVGRRFAAQRWCKSCGLKRGKIRRGRWYSQVSYGFQDKFYYEQVMHAELNVDIHCAKCPPRRRVDGEALWWGCAGCFDKEELRLQKMDSERRRNIGLHCYHAKLAVKSMADPELVMDRTKCMARWVREEFGWTGINARSWQIKHWFTDETPWDRLGRHCGDARLWVDRVDVRYTWLGRKTKSVTDRLSRKSKAAGENEQVLEGVVPDCFVCTDSIHSPATIAVLDDIEARTGSRPTIINGHACTKLPRHEVRCSGCWRAKRSRRRRRYDWGMAYGSPLPERGWCEGCRADRQNFIRSERDRRIRHTQMREQLSPRNLKVGVAPRPVKFELPEPDMDLRGLFDVDTIGHEAVSHETVSHEA